MKQLSARRTFYLRAAVLAATAFGTANPGRADMLSVLTQPSGFYVVNEWYTIPQPSLNAGQKITGFNMNVGLQSSTVGINNPPASPSINGVLVPNPLVTPPPDCGKKGADCILTTSTLNGVDPKLKNNAPTAEFDFNLANSSLTKGANANVAGDATKKTAPAVGATTRTDTLDLAWDARGQVDFFPTPIKGQKAPVNALLFGASLNYQQASWLGPPPIGLTQIWHSLPTQAAYNSSSWTLNDGTTMAGPKTSLAVAMGQNDFFGPAGDLLAGLVFTYTNTSTFAEDLSDLTFATSAAGLSLSSEGLGGTPLYDPQVTVNGSPESVQSDYDLPAGYTIQFLFPDTTDPYFIVDGDVSTDGVFQLGFGYEAQVLPPVPEPSAILLLATAVGVLVLARGSSLFPTC